MAYNLGSAYIQIVPTSKGMGREIEKELSGVGGRASKGLGGKLWGGLKKTAVGAGIALGGILTGSIVKGFQRLTAIEDAEAKLAGLGNSAEDVQKIMDNALAAVKGTAFGMDEAATTAASAVAAGIEPGKDLEHYLGLVGDAAAIAGTDMSTMGSIFNKVATSGKVQGDVFAQLGDAGIPIVQMLSEELGVTAEEVYKMGSAGEIGTEDFLKAMGSMEGAAMELGGTTSGAWRNMGAAMSRFGAALLEEVYPHIAPVLGKVTELFDYLTDQAGPALEWVSGKIEPFVNGLKGIWDVLAGGNFTGAENLFGFEEDSAFVGFLFGVRDVAIDLYEKALKPLGKWIADNWQPIAAALGGIVAFFVGGAIVSAIGAVGGAIAAFVGGISWIAVAIGAAVGALTWFFTETELGQQLLGRFVSFVRDTLWPGIVGAFTAVRDFVVDELWPRIKQSFEAIRDLAVQVWQGVIQPAFEQFAGFVRDTVMPIIQRLWEEYVQPAFTAIGGLAVWLWENAIKPYWSMMVDFVGNTLGPILVWLWENIVSPVFGWIGDYIAWAWEKVIFPALDALKYFVMEVLPPALKWLWETAKTVWSGIQKAIGAVVSWFQTWAWPVISLVIELIKLGFSIMRDAISAAWRFVRDNVIRPVITWFRDTAWPLISGVLESIKRGFNAMRDSLRTAWNYVRDKVINPVATWFRDKIEPLFGRATDDVGNAFSTLKDVVKKAWDGIKAAAKAPVRFVVETVINSALIGNFNKLAGKLGTKKLPKVSLPKGFARGGVLPGMSSYRDGDDQLVPMRRGEGVIVSEALRDPASRSLIYAINQAALRGKGSLAAMMGGGYAGGGIIDGVRGLGSKAKDLAGHALDKVLEGVDFVAEALSDPKAIFTKVYDAVVGNIPAAGLMTDLAKGAGKKVLNGVVDSVLGAFGPGSDADVGPMPAGASRSLSYARSVAAAMGLTMTSFRRPGARTAGSGSLSLHAQGRAMDFSNSSGPTPQMMRFFNAMHPLRPTELLYSPAGGRQWRRWGAQQNTSGATRRNHFNHVHVGFNKGGIFDQGGLMEPGMTGINLTRKPEAVLDPAQTRAYQAHAESVSRGDGKLDLSDSTLDRLADRLAERPNVVQIGTRQAGHLAAAGAGAKRAMGGSW